AHPRSSRARSGRRQRAAKRAAWALDGHTRQPAASSAATWPRSPWGSPSVPTTEPTTASLRPAAAAVARASRVPAARGPARAGCGGGGAGRRGAPQDRVDQDPAGGGVRAGPPDGGGPRLGVEHGVRAPPRELVRAEVEDAPGAPVEERLEEERRLVGQRPAGE